MALVGSMADESMRRKTVWLRDGCNSFDGANPTGKPMSFWTEQDVLQYVVENNIKLAAVYGEIVPDGGRGQIAMTGCGKLKCTGCDRTGWEITAA